MFNYEKRFGYFEYNFSKIFNFKRCSPIRSIWHWILYEFRQEKNVAEASRPICLVYGSDALELRTCQIWLARFRVQDKEHTSRPNLMEEDDLKA